MTTRRSRGLTLGFRKPGMQPAPEDAPGPATEILRISGLRTHIETRAGLVKAVDGVDLTVRRGESVGVVGESGSGKSMTCLSVMRLLPRSARVVGGEIDFDGVDLATASERTMQSVRGSRIAMIMQDSLSALNPVLTVGDQIAEPVRRHLGLSRSATAERVVEVMRELQIPQPETRLRQYPHQFSGGTRQRIVAAMALAARPELILADEPTTALDVTVQARFLTLIRTLQQRTGVAVLWITHDLGLVAQMCDRVNVMYAGRIVESGSVQRIFKQPRHPYTKALLDSVPTIGQGRHRLRQIDGQPPDLLDLPPGCPFAARCPVRMDVCDRVYPERTVLGAGESVRCWRESA
ncbi:ABC transporter ATP-binding protein [Pseudonocardia sp.]|uniref:ABC transporter ATP-binding protein n=1 Tax=Pseudonocardia sp. TaxID=60912 RepID=UPI003D0C92CC